MAPAHYLGEDPRLLPRFYVGDCLREEIPAESLVHNQPSFRCFLDAAVFCNGRMVNHAAVARDIGVSAPSVRGYFGTLPWSEFLRRFWAGEIIPTH
jgi:hypothetical protein